MKQKSAFHFPPAWAIVLGFLALCGGWGCHSLSKAERAMCQQSPQALCTGVVKAYKTQDVKAFSDLSISYQQVKDMMEKVKVPSTAKRESITKLGAGGYADMIQDSLQTVLKASAIDWPKASFEKFEATRNPVEIATGYKMLLGKLHLQVGEQRYIQPVTVIEVGKGQFFMGDFGPFEALE